ncbi:WSC domain-containing protein [Gymnopilus junonius]|uniref:WSC domain-containing protein n=1 Tax=Gymnopilus junonius TaxID=109634 RepID=A0A9P5NIL6_GYMJU|nr:WSC domain-containing protein [Gymnopilus junonius]
MILSSFLGVLFFIIVQVMGSPVLEGRQTGALPAGWAALGCYSDSTSARTLRVASYTDLNDMTIESCISFCSNSTTYAYAGVEFSRECYCDNVIESPGEPISSVTCDMACTGNPDEICGGSDGINIFQNTALPPPPPPPPVPVIKQSVGTFDYVGCFDDGVDGAPRSLQNQLLISGGVTAESCTAACQAAGYVLAGLEYGQECWCDSYMPLAISTPDSDCSMACQADDTEICGAGNRLTVYQDTSAPPLNVLSCLTNSQLHASNGAFKFNLQAVPTAGGGAPLVVGSFELPAQVGQPTYFQLSTASVDREAHSFSISGGSLYPDDFEGEGNPIPIGPAIGGLQMFAAWSTFTPYVGYCAKPNPISHFGPFVGPPVLSVNNHADLWALCGIAPVIYSPISTSPGYTFSECQNVLLEMTQYSFTF